MRYASDAFGNPPLGVEPQPRDHPQIATIEICDYYRINLITILDKNQLQETVDLLRHASVINGWGEIK